jgi:anthranilate phosphoribosyltransferase
MNLAALLDTLCDGKNLSQEESHALFSAVMRGEVADIELSALLVALKSKGETADEIAGAAHAMREAALRLDTGGMHVADSCGTGGDGAHTLNISTAAALVGAEAGIAMAKHGNRSISSRCGSADVLERCGIAIEAPPETAKRSLDEVGICFLFAPQYHAGVRHAMPVRRALGVRTMFNLLGPLANPASPRWQLTGVYDPRRCRVMAETLGLLGCERALVVHGSGLDEIALHDVTSAALLEDGHVRELELTPEQAGLTRADRQALRGGAPEDNARWLEELLAGRASRVELEAVAINAGALLWVCGQAADLRRGTEQALDILSSGRARTRLDRWREIQRGA